MKYTSLPRTFIKVGGIGFKTQNKRSYALEQLSAFLYRNNCYQTFEKELKAKFGILSNEEVIVGSPRDYGYQNIQAQANQIYFVIEYNCTRSLVSLDLAGIIRIHELEKVKFQHDVYFDSPNLEDSFETWKSENGFSDLDIDYILSSLGIVDDIDLCLESSPFTAVSYFKKDKSKAAFCFYRKDFTLETCDHMHTKTGHNLLFINDYIIMFKAISWPGQVPEKPQVYKVTRNKMGRPKINRSYFPPFRILRTSNNYLSHVMCDSTLDINLRKPYTPPKNKKGPVGPQKYSEIYFRGLNLSFPQSHYFPLKKGSRTDLKEVPNDQSVRRYLESIDIETTSIVEILNTIKEFTGCYIGLMGSINMTYQNPTGVKSQLAIVHYNKEKARTFELNDIDGDKKIGRIECDTYRGYEKGTPMPGRAKVEYFVPEQICSDGIKLPGIRLEYIFEGTEALDIPEELDITNYFLNLPYMPKNDYKYIWNAIGLKIVLANPGCTKVTRILEVDGRCVEELVHNEEELDNVRELYGQRVKSA